MKIKLLLTAVVCLSFGQPAMAKPSINDMQGCQAVIDFVDAKLDTVGSKYDAVDVEIVRNGLNAYHTYIQVEIVTPGLLEFNGGDKGKADAMQMQVDAYKTTVTNVYATKYPQERLFAHHAVAINECAKKAVPAGADLEALKAALNKIIELAKKG
jgi:hypothetical protein